MALEIASDPGGRSLAVAALDRDAYAASSTGPRLARRKTWNDLGLAAGFAGPFSLTPLLVRTVMGALKAACFRSAEGYLSVAKQEHVARGR